MNGAAMIDTVEAAYRLDSDETTWLASLCRAARPAFPYAEGELVAFSAQITRKDGLRMRALCAPFDKDRIEAENRAVPADLWLKQASICSSAREHFTSLGQRDLFEKLPKTADGVVDHFGVGATSPHGSAIMLVSLCKKYPPPTPLAVRERWGRVTAHLLAGLRLRDQLVREEAVAEPGGKLLHAEGEARSRSLQDDLREAVRNIDRARSKRGRRNPDEALTIWKGLVSGRWSLVDRFESDGRRFVVACRNEPLVEDPRALTKRERQVIAYAAYGYADKEIAYHLGLERSTIATHLATAMRKLRIASRVDLVKERALFERPS